jgi:DNA gyrase subunit A
MGKLRDKGVPIDNVSNFSTSKEDVVLLTSQSDLNLYRLLFVTKKSMMKVVDGGEFDVSKRTIAGTKFMDDEDEVLSVEILKELKNIILQTKEGYFLRFAVDEIPMKKKNAIGVRGMKLGDKDLVEAVYYTLNTVDKTIDYKGRTLELNKLKLGRRDSKGVKVRA